MNHLQNSNLIAAAIGMTVGVISAAGIFIYHKILENRQHTTVVTNLDDAQKKIAELQAELEALRLQQSQQKKKRKLTRKITSNDSTYTVTDNDTDVDLFSTVDTDFGDDEFYDCSDSDGEHDLGISEELNQLDSVLKETDKDVTGDSKYEIYDKLQTLAQSHRDNVEVIWRFARACYEYADTLDDTNVKGTSLKRKIILEGIEYCENILTVEHANLYKWYAILLGINGDYLATVEKIKNGVQFRSYIEKALEIQPDDSQSHYLLGRFKYEIANISWWERKVAAAALFTEIPSASHEEALACFETALKLGNKGLHTLLYISKCHIALKQYSNAIDYLEEIMEKSELTDEIYAESSKLLKKCRGYQS